MKKVNGSRETPAETVARIEQRLNKLRDDLQKITNPGKPQVGNGFQNFLKTNVMDRRN